jgi:hypothetical protein
MRFPLCLYSFPTIGAMSELVFSRGSGDETKSMTASGIVMIVVFVCRKLPGTIDGLLPGNSIADRASVSTTIEQGIPAGKAPATNVTMAGPPGKRQNNGKGINHFGRALQPSHDERSGYAHS